MTDIDSIRERWERVGWIYGEEQEDWVAGDEQAGQYVAGCHLIQDGQRVLKIKEPTDEQQQLLSLAASAPGDVQALLAELERVAQQTVTLLEQIQHAEADGIAAHRALQEAVEHLQRGEQPDMASRRRWEAALAPFARSRLLGELAAARTLAEACRAHPGCLVDDGELAAALVAYDAARKGTRATDA